jgi:hypothetical protein
MLPACPLLVISRNWFDRRLSCPSRARVDSGLLQEMCWTRVDHHGAAVRGKSSLADPMLRRHCTGGLGLESGNRETPQMLIQLSTSRPRKDFMLHDRSNWHEGSSHNAELPVGVNPRCDRLAFHIVLVSPFACLTQLRLPTRTSSAQFAKLLFSIA